MNYSDILELCTENRPDLIYIAVGSATHEGGGQGVIQQYPPFVKDWPGKKLCIWIDPLLEDPPRSVSTHTFTKEDNLDIWKSHDVLCIPLRKYFHYLNESSDTQNEHIEDKQFIEELCKLTLLISAKLILQDYTGREIHKYYPFHVGPILESVLYDVTYNDSGCYIDFDTVRILFNDAGGFIQPGYSSLSAIHGKIPDLLFERELARRRLNLTYIHTYLCCSLGLREAGEWLTEEYIQHDVNRLSYIYKVNTLDLKGILIAAATDICEVASCPITNSEIDIIVSSPSQQYATLLQNLQIVLKIAV